MKQAEYNIESNLQKPFAITFLYLAEILDIIQFQWRRIALISVLLKWRHFRKFLTRDVQGLREPNETSSFAWYLGEIFCEMPVLYIDKTGISQEISPRISKQQLTLNLYLGNKMPVPILLSITFAISDKSNERL